MPDTYPDWLLTAPIPVAVDYIILNTPVKVVLAAQFKNTVHRSPNVNIPENIEHQLCVGMKYMFHSKRNVDLIQEAWEDFDNRICW
jgi:hypothetical protein